MPRFVVLRHEPGSNGPRELHWDLMLEVRGSLRTWALEQRPAANAAIIATELPAHRIAYLEYEGEISDDRGSVSRVEWGTYTMTRESSDKLDIEVRGENLRGIITLRHEEDQRWVVVFDAG